MIEVAVSETTTGGMVGRAIPRTHDPRLLRGHGRYVDDIDDTGVLHAAIIRSPIPHGRITEFDPADALESDDVVLVLGPDDMDRLTEPLPTTWRIHGQHQVDVPLAAHTVRYAGQPIGVVVATSRAVAEDAAALVYVDFDELPIVATVDDALADDAPRIYPDAADNVVGVAHFGDTREQVDQALADAPHVVERELSVQRVNYGSIEPRGILAEWVPTTEQMLIHVSSQVAHLLRWEAATALRLRMDQVRVVSPDVGGGFGGKTTMYVDEAMVCLAAKVLGRRVKWIEDRKEALTADYQGRGQTARARLGLDRDGRFLALHVDMTGDQGAFVNTAGTGPFQSAASTIEGAYRFPVAGSTLTCVYTNRVPTGPYRGYGRQESSWIRERMIDEAARELGIDPIELRRINMIGPDEMPYTTRTGLVYDSGDYPEAFERAVELASERTLEPAERVRRGMAVTVNVESTGFAPTAVMEDFGIDWSGWEGGRVRVNQDGTVTVFSGVTPMGQGIETTLAQIVADHLDVPLDWIRVELGDSATAPFSNFSSQASRSLMVGGAAVLQAADRMNARMTALAAGAMGVDVEDVDRDGDTFRAGDTTIAWREVARRGWLGWGRPDGDVIELEELVQFDPPGMAYAYAVHAAVVAVDLDTGKVAIEDYWAVHDSGVIVNPLVADGQVAGGIAQGIGIALLEEAVFDPESAQPLAITYLDYAMPLAEDVPELVIEHTCHPAPDIPGGFKGLGEAGIMPPAPTIGSAIANAVPEIAESLVATPMSPLRIWTALDAKGLAS